MANLETLELTISANSQSAVQGIEKLTHSLVALGVAITAPLRQLTLLNQQLRTLKSFAGIKMPGMGGTGGKYRQAGTPISKNQAMNMVNNTSQKELLTQKAQGMMSDYVTNATAGTMNQKELAQGALAIKKITQQIEDADRKASKFQQTMGQVGRIFKTMLIRTAIRSLIKAFGDAWESAYEFSKKMGGDFAKNIDSIKGSLKGASVAIINAFAPLMNIVAPVINVIAQGIKYLSDLILQLLSLLGLTAEKLGGAAESASSAGKNSSKAAKDSLAKFDELNVLNKDSGSGKGGGSSPKFSSQISDELAKIQALVGEFMIAIGLVLAFTGHIPIGVGMIAVGAAMMVKTVAVDWGKLTKQTKGEIAKIMAYAGGAMLAVGVILALTNANLGLGLGLIAAGAVSLAASASVSWKLSADVKGAIADVLAAVSGGLLALGAILAFTSANVPLGIGLMIAGASTLAASVGITWSLDEDISSKVGRLELMIGGALLALGAAIAFTGASLPIGIGLMIAGAASLASAAIINSDALPNEVKNTVEKIMGILGGAMLVIGAILCLTGAGIPLGLGMMAVGGISLAAAIAPNWGSIEQNIRQAFDSISKYLTEKWLEIQNAVTAAWEIVKTWINAKWSDFGKAWTDIKYKLVQKWEDIKAGVNNAWEKVKEWINTKWSNFSSGWDNIKSNLVQRWNDIKKSITDAKDKVKEWWEQGSNGFVTKIRGAWNGLAGWFEKTVTKPIDTAWSNVKKTIKGVINTFIDALNKLGSFNIPEIKILGKVIIPKTHVTLWNIPHVATGAYGMESGQLFIANERGAEMVGSMDGKTAVANQQQIVEGIRKGVADGQAEQNNLLRQQNQILMSILQKTGNGLPGASSAFGRVVSQSLDMYSMMVGR